MSFIKAVIERLAPLQPAPAKPAAKRAEAAAADPAAQIEGAIKALIAQHGALLAGSIHFIDLQPLKERLGTGWTAAEGRIHELCRRIILKHLGERDIHIQYGPLEYLLVFADMAKPAAQLKCLKISEEIWTRLVGVEGLEAMRVKTAVAVVDGSLICEKVTVAACLEQVAETLKAPEAQLAPSRPEAPATPVDPPDGLDWHIERPDFDFSRVRFAYRPMWDAVRGVISRYVCCPRLGGNIDHEILPPQWLPQLAPELDLRLLADVQTTLRELHANRFRFAAYSLVHFETLASTRHRLRYAEACKRLEAEMQRYFCLEMVGVPIGVPSARLFEIAAACRSQCQSLSLRTDLRFGGFDAVRDAGIRAVGIDLARDPRPESQLMLDLSLFAERAEKHGLVTYAHGVRSRSLALAAVTAGFAFLDGEPVLSLRDWPGHLVRFGLADLYGRGQGGAA